MLNCADLNAAAATAAWVRRSCSCSRLMTWSAYRFSPRSRSRAAFSAIWRACSTCAFTSVSSISARRWPRLTASPSCTWMRRTTPPILKDRRISSLLTTMPLVSIGGTAGPWLACAMRTGVGLGASGVSPLLQPVNSAASATTATMSPPVKVQVVLMRFMGSIQRQRARGSGVIELGLAREHFETRDIGIEFGAREARARVDEFHLADDAFVALAAGDAEARARRLRTRVGRGQRVGAGVQPVEGLLDLELHLLHQLVVLRLRAA